MRMNKKAVIALSLVLVAAAVAMLSFPVSAALNGDTLQTQDKIQLRDGSCDGCTYDCACDGDCQQFQYKTQLKLQTQECFCQNVGVNAP